MAISEEALIIRLEASSRKLERQLVSARKQINKFSANTERRFDQMNAKNAASFTRLDASVQKSMGGLRRALAPVLTALSAREVVRYADAWTEAGNKMNSASEVSGLQARSLDDLTDSANDARVSMSQYVDLYSRLLRSSKMVGASELEVAQATDVVSKSLKAGGASAQEQAAALIQLGQALSSGFLQGDELRSIRENAPLLAQAIAKEFGVTIGELKQLGAEGKITSDRVFSAILAAQPDIEAAFARTNSTIGNSLTKLENEFIRYIGNADDSTLATEKIVESLNYLADNFEGVADVVVQFATFLAGAFAGKVVVSGIGNIVAALGAFITAARTGTIVAGGFMAALGPVTLISGAAALALSHFASESAHAAARAADVNKMLVEMGIKSRDAAEGLDDVADAQKNLSTAKGIAEKAAAVEKFNEQLVVTNDNMMQLLRHFVSFAEADSLGGPVSDQKQFAIAAAKTTGAFIDQKISAEQLKEELDALTVKFPDFATLASTAITYANALDEVRRGAAQLALVYEATAGQGTPRGDVGAGRRSVIKKSGVGDSYISEQERLLSLTKQQRDVEEEIASIKRDVLADGGIITDAAAERLAKLRVESRDTKKSGSKKSPEDIFKDSFDGVQLRIAALIAETNAQKTLNPLIDDYGYTLEKARSAHELLAAAQKAGLAITPELKASIDTLAEGYAAATVSAAKLAEEQEIVRASAEDLRDSLKEVTRGFVDDLLAGKTAAEALGGALGKVGDKLLDLAFDGLFGGGGNKSNPFGMIGSMFGFAKGGIAAHGRPQPLPMFAGGGVSKSAAIFGEAGPEAAVPLPDGRRIPVDLRMPANNNSGPQVILTYAPVIDATGADQAALERLQQGLIKSSREFEAKVIKTVKSMPSRNL